MLINQRKKLLPILFASIFLLSFFMANVHIAKAHETEEDYRPPLVKGKILEIVSDETKQLTDFGFNTRTQMLKIKILEGTHKGEVIDGENNIAEEMAYQIIAKEGQQVLLMIEEDASGNIQNAFVAEVVRDKYLYVLILIFVLLMIIVGGLKGIKSLITLFIIVVSIFKFMIPSILHGGNPVVLTVFISIFATVLTLLLIGGFDKKTYASIIGTIGGVICAGLVAYIFADLASLSGLSMDESVSLNFIPQGTEFNFKGLLLSGIILGALGAVMDVSMSIASSINEINLANPLISLKELFRSGMNVGKDVMGTMANTLILAYTGTSINLILLITAYDIPFKEIINKDVIASEIVRGLTGTIGLIFTIPITAIIAATLYKSNKR